MMRILVFLLCWLLCVPAYAGDVTLTRKQMLKIGKALKTCKAAKKKHAVELKALRDSYELKLKHQSQSCGKGLCESSPWMGLVFFTIGAVTAGVIVGVVVWNVQNQQIIELQKVKN